MVTAGAPADPGVLDGVMAARPVVRAWSGIRIGGGVSFADLHLWLAGFLPGFCKLAASDATALAAEEVGKGWFPFGSVRGDSFAYQASRKADEPGVPVFEFGAGAYGPHAGVAADALIEQIRVWDRHGRDLPGNAFTFWPAGTVPPPQQPDTAVFRKIHGTVTVSWPAAEPAANTTA